MTFFSLFPWQLYLGYAVQGFFTGIGVAIGADILIKNTMPKLSAKIMEQLRKAWRKKDGTN